MFQVVKGHLFQGKTGQKRALCDADVPNGIHPHSPRPSGARKVFTCLKKQHSEHNFCMKYVVETLTNRKARMSAGSKNSWMWVRSSMPMPVKNKDFPGESMSASTGDRA
jgi:hypothetical protein